MLNTNFSKLLLVVVFYGLFPSNAHATDDCVILLHGLGRTAKSMQPIEEVLRVEGYQSVNVDYPSRTQPIATLAVDAVRSGLDECAQDAAAVHFVTHSLGGILVRHYLAHHELETLGRVVMLGPPNQGSELVDTYREVPGYERIGGPASVELGTDADSVPVTLGPVDFSLGVIAGNRSFNPVLSATLPKKDDGKVAVANTKIEGMTDFIEMPHTHSFMMRVKPVHEQIISFLKTGQFIHESIAP